MMTERLANILADWTLQIIFMNKYHNKTHCAT